MLVWGSRRLGILGSEGFWFERLGVWEVEGLGSEQALQTKACAENSYIL